MNIKNKPEDVKIRLSKRLSELQICSRRVGEELIKAKCVRVNNEVVDNCAFLVSKEDRVKVANVPLNLSERVFEANESGLPNLYALYKPAGYVVSREDENGKKIVYDIIPNDLKHLKYIGRLDLNSEGLLLFTNSGDFAHKIESPKYNIPRVYRVRAHGRIDHKKFTRMKKGAWIDGDSFLPKSIELATTMHGKIVANPTHFDSSNACFEVTLTRGKNREIRRYFEHFGLQVNRLIRKSFGVVNLIDFPKGSFVQIENRIVQQMVKKYKLDETK